MNGNPFKIAVHSIGCFIHVYDYVFSTSKRF